MRVLLDECVPRKLSRELPGHDVRTVAEMGWAGMGARSNAIEDLRPLIPRVLTVLTTAKAGEVVVAEA